MTADGFFEILKRKISRTPDRRFDQMFWAKFEGEFGVSPDSVQPGFLDRILGGIRPVRHVLAFGAVAGLAAVVIVKAPWKESEIDSTAAPVVASMGLLENIELFETLDDVELSDQDWKFLIDEESVG